MFAIWACGILEHLGIRSLGWQNYCIFSRVISKCLWEHSLEFTVRGLCHWMFYFLSLFTDFVLINKKENGQTCVLSQAEILQKCPTAQLFEQL